MTFKIKDMKALNEFAEFYHKYEILDFINLDMSDEKSKQSILFNQNFALLAKAFSPLHKIATEFAAMQKELLAPLSDNFYSTTGTSFLTHQVVKYKLVSKERYEKVSENLMMWQNTIRGEQGVDSMNKLLTFMTGVH